MCVNSLFCGTNRSFDEAILRFKTNDFFCISSARLLMFDDLIIFWYNILIVKYQNGH